MTVKCRASCLTNSVRFAADVDQIHGRVATGSEGWSEANVRRHQSRSDRCHVNASVEAAALRCRFPSHDCPGTPQVRTDRLEHSVRVQPGGLHYHRPVYPEPSRRPRS